MGEFPEHVVVCPPWNAVNASEAGVTTAECAVCEVSVCISPSSRKLMGDIKGMEPVCAGCMEVAAADQGETVPMLVAPRVRQELIERTGMTGEAVDELIEYVRDLGPEEAARRVRQFHEKPGSQN